METDRGRKLPIETYRETYYNRQTEIQRKALRVEQRDRDRE